MIFNSQPCTSREQSKRLLDLGIKKETADMYYPNGIQDSEHIIRAVYPTFWESDKKMDAFIRGRVTPAWSLDRLIDMLKGQNMPEDYQVSFFVGINRYDEIIALIQSLIHINEFNTDYLNQ